MNHKRIAYVRVSTAEQSLARQLEGMGLKPSEFDNVFMEHATGSNTNRPELQKLLEFVRDGDKVFVHSMDRLARNLPDLFTLVETFKAKGVTLRFVKENLTFDATPHPMQTMLLGVMGSLAQFERELLLERQREGIAIARREGKYRGRSRRLSRAQMKELREAASENVDGRATYTRVELAEKFGVSVRTVFNYLEAE